MNTNSSEDNIQKINQKKQNSPAVKDDKMPSIWPITLVVWLLSAPIIYVIMIMTARSIQAAGWMALLGPIAIIPMQIFHILFLVISITLISLIPWRLRYILLPTFVSFFLIVFGLIFKISLKLNVVSLMILLSSIFITLIYHFQIRKKCNESSTCEIIKWNAKSYLWLIVVMILPIFLLFQFLAANEDISAKESKLNRSIISQSDISSNCEMSSPTYNADGMSSSKVSQSLKCMPVGENLNNVTLINNIEIKYLPGHLQFNDQFNSYNNCVNYPLDPSIKESKMCVDQFRRPFLTWIQGDYEFTISGTFNQDSRGWAEQDLIKLNELIKNTAKIIVEKNSDLY